jgi:uncharacterized membrane protein
MLRFLLAVVIISSLLVLPAFCRESEDSQVFIAGFNAFQQKNYTVSIDKMNEVLQKYPETPLRDMALFWLARSYYKAGNQQEAARYLSQFSKEYPDNPLKSTVEEELLALTARYDSGEKLPSGTPPVASPDRVAAQKPLTVKERAVEARRAAAAAEAARVAALKQSEENAAADKREAARLAAANAEQERVAAATAEQERRIASAKAAEKADAERKEQQRIAAAQSEEATLAAARTREELRAAAAKETARVAAQKAENERVALVKAEEARKAEAAARNKAEKELAASAERSAREEEANRLASLKAEEERLSRQKRAEEKGKTAKQSYREKAISQYQAIIDKYPSSTAAATAAAKLRELGVAVALPPKTSEAPSIDKAQENAQVLRLEVAQYAGFEFNLLSRPDSFPVGRPLAVPFEVINRGNGRDAFYLESSFPSDFKARFASSAEPAVAISQTPELAPGETFKGVVNLVIPPSSIDGLRIAHPVKAASRLMSEASQSREIRLAASAPLLRAVLRTEKARPLPGDKVAYRIAILNVGSTAAQDVTFRLNFPPQLDPVDAAAGGFRQEMKSALVVDGLKLNSGESRDYNVTFQLKDDSLAGQELLTRAELTNNSLKTNAAFVSNVTTVEAQHGISVRTGSERLVAIPGQTLALPFVVTNTGNIREKFRISSLISGIKEAIIFNDLNRDGIRQASEPVISDIGPLAPREEASVVVEIKTSTSVADGSQGNVQISFISEGDSVRSATGSTQLTYSRPLLKMVMAGRDGRLKPGDVASFDLTITNNGSNLARVVELQSAWPEQLEQVAADPAISSVNNGTVVWRFKEMGAGEKKSIRVSFRVKPGTGVGTAIQVKNILTYEDQLGNRY